MNSLSISQTPAPVYTQTSTSTAVPLHKLVDQLMNSFVPLAATQRSFIINNVEENFQLNADEQVLAFIVGNLINNAIASSNGACIRVEAVKKPQGVQIIVRNNGSNFYSTVAHGFSQVVAAARSVGGSINIYNQAHEGTVITLSMAA
ncbi:MULTISPECIES: sensor histidine kinase [Niastella]|uniref:histidine kinase n=1 Tax=Niastella soli TaxID=2821487 RepID=A0ABS3Z029_9BACT|nr:HAMP domain-containing histidine kinase [Niastella soli]MBO9203527.1 HAMP domain-containing histidine kinase [Niastella soli]